MRKTFSITDKEVLKKLEEVESQSQYIQSLIIKDIYTEQIGGDYEAGIMATVKLIEDSLDIIKDRIKENDE